jgi:5'-phosphate synthase pdxT subunit
MILGILGIQGDFGAHKSMAESLGVKTLIVRTPEDFEKIDGLVIPGGETTAITKLLSRYNLIKPVKKFHREGKPIFGTCAGMVLLAKKIDNHLEQFSFGFMDISVKRNAYGRQIDSFEEDIVIPALGKKPFHGVFIRAPKISKIGKNVESMAKHGSDHILVREGNVLAGSFHPELTEDVRIYEYFLEMVKKSKP